MGKFFCQEKSKDKSWVEDWPDFDLKGGFNFNTPVVQNIDVLLLAGRLPYPYWKDTTVNFLRQMQFSNLDVRGFSRITILR